MSEQRNYIAGEWVPAAATSPDLNPSNTNDVLGHYPQASAEDAQQAIAAAQEAFPAWSRSTPQLRHDALKRIGDELLARKEEIGTLLAREEGKTLGEGIGETVRAAQIFLFFAGEALRMAGDNPFVTDGGHFILDASFGRIPDTRALSNALHAVPGVVEHGLFLGMADAAMIAGADGVEVLLAAR